MIEHFHFLRPWWLTAFPLSFLIVRAVHRASDPKNQWNGIVAPHLVPHLVRGAADGKRPMVFAMTCIGLFLGTIVLAGPSWKKEKSPFADDVAAVAVVVKVTPSMKTEDLAPDRLTRSLQKVHDLLSLRGGAKTALIAYAGSAHLVMPPTVDPEIIDTFGASLDPSIMPVEGDAAADALRLAESTLKTAGGGSIVWITDEVAPDQIGKISPWSRDNPFPVKILAPLGDTEPVRKAAGAAKAEIVRVTPDDADVDALARAAKFETGYSSDESSRWKDGGYPLVLLLALTLLPFFRKGWMPTIAAKS